MRHKLTLQLIFKHMTLYIQLSKIIEAKWDFNSAMKLKENISSLTILGGPEACYFRVRPNMANGPLGLVVRTHAKINMPSTFYPSKCNE